jgi:tRNA(fMet)-specific endonuclease VapC
MTSAELIADTNIVSYLFRNSVLGTNYRCLIGDCPIGITSLSLEELYYGAALNRWGDAKRQRLDSFLKDFVIVQWQPEVAEICGSLRAERRRVGRPIELADAWVAATALWNDIPVVTHDRDLEAIPGLRVVTLHDGWQIRGTSSAGAGSVYSRSFEHRVGAVLESRGPCLVGRRLHHEVELAARQDLLMADE